MKRLWYWNMLVVVLALVVYWQFKGERIEFARATSNPYCDDVVVRVINGTTLIPEDLELRREEGFYAVIEFSPRIDLPEEIEGLFVENPCFWHLIVKIYEETKWPNQEEVGYSDCRQFRDDRLVALESASPGELARQQDLGDLVGSSDLWRKSAGFDGKEPKEPNELPSHKVRRWMFLAPPQTINVDRFIYEIVLLPHAHNVTSLKTVFGPPVGRRRGVMTVK